MYVGSLFFLTLLTVENVESAVSPVVAFNPDWNKIFTGESMNMTCEVSDMTEEGDVIYHWFKDGDWIHSGKSFTISSAQKSNSGNYQCQTSTGNRSDSVRLEVHHGFVILQVPPYVYEGDNLTLRCHHYPGYTAGQTIFEKNAVITQGWGPEDELQIENVNITSSSKYKCTKQVWHHLSYYQHTDEASISVQELFSIPTIRLSSHSVTEGDRMILTCHTSLSPLRKTTVLKFAFNRDGKSMREFSSSNKYEIKSAKQQHSGDYTCEIKASNYIKTKISATLTIPVNRTGGHELINQSSIEVTSKPGYLLKQDRAGKTGPEGDFQWLHYVANDAATSCRYWTSCERVVLTRYDDCNWYTPALISEGTSHVIIAVSVTLMVLILVVTVLILLYRARHFQPVNSQQPSKVVYSERPDEIENIYTDLDTNNTWRDSSQNPHKLIVYDPAAEKQVIVC